MRVDSNEEYSASDSDDEYTANEKVLLNKVRNRDKEYSDNEENIFGVNVESESDDEDEDNNSNLALSDVEGQEDDDLPDVRAWGKDKRKFYQTDYVDGDYGGFQGKDAQLADLEEEEARNLQKQLAQHIDDDDFDLDIFAKKPEEDEKQNEEIVKTDISKLSKRQKIQILQKESPEFFNLIEDFQSKMTTAKMQLHPLLKKVEKGEITQCKAAEFVQMKYELILNYCTNIYMYLLLKSSKVNIQNHPVIKRLYQYRQLILQLEPIYKEVIKPQIETLLTKDVNDDTKKPKKLKKPLKLILNINFKSSNNNKETLKRKTNEITVPEKVKKVKFDEKILLKEKRTNNDQDLTSSEEENEDDKNVDELDEDVLVVPSKRGITYEMAKNKGLTPHRKKEQRNPRVKHKLKYRKAVIRRKGAVREPRKELSRYGGEISGIKMTVSRSIKIKT